jgi:hypothetical protein
MGPYVVGSISQPAADFFSVASAQSGHPSSHSQGVPLAINSSSSTSGIMDATSLPSRRTTTAVQCLTAGLRPC